MKTLLGITAYNEGPHLGRLLDAIQAANLPGWIDVAFVDDCSTDDTRDILAASPHIVLRHALNLGQGKACNTLMRAAVAWGYDAVLTMDGDGQHDPADAPRFVEALRGSTADVICGSRLLGSDYQGTPFLRRSMLPLVNLVINRLTGYTLTDTMCGYRAYRTDSLAKIMDELNGLLENNYTAAELFMRFSDSKLKVSEIPIDIKARTSGSSSKGTIRYAIGIAKTILRLFTHRLVRGVSR